MVSYRMSSKPPSNVLIGLIRKLSLVAIALILPACFISVGPNNRVSQSNRLGWYPGTVVQFRADVDFTDAERVDITAACDMWSRFTGANASEPNGRGITCRVVFDRDFRREPYVGEVDDYAIIKETRSSLMSRYGDDVDNALAVTEWRLNNRTGERRLVVSFADDMIDRYNLDMYPETRDDAYRVIAAHEFGHAFGFDHVCYRETDYCPGAFANNIMNPVYNPSTVWFGTHDFNQCHDFGFCSEYVTKP